MNLVRRYLPALTRDGWLRASFWTLGTTAVTCVIAIAASALVKTAQGSALTAIDSAAAIGISLLLSVPVIGTLSVKIQQLRLANEKIRLYATTDPMTGLLNRDTFTRYIETLLAPPPPAREGMGPGCFLALDVDHFKSVNDAFGHHWGDEALKLISAAIRSELRSCDLCGRLGGEEFGVFVVGVDREEAIVVANRVRQAVAAITFAPGGLACPLSVSIGVGVGQRGGSFTDLYREGDRLLYNAKHNGRNRVEIGETVPLSRQIWPDADGDRATAPKQVATQ